MKEIVGFKHSVELKSHRCQESLFIYHLNVIDRLNSVISYVVGGLFIAFIFIWVVRRLN